MSSVDNAPAPVITANGLPGERPDAKDIHHLHAKTIASLLRLTPWRSLPPRYQQLQARQAKSSASVPSIQRLTGCKTAIIGAVKEQQQGIPPMKWRTKTN